MMKNSSTMKTDLPGCRLLVIGYTALYNLHDEEQFYNENRFARMSSASDWIYSVIQPS